MYKGNQFNTSQTDSQIEFKSIRYVSHDEAMNLVDDSFNLYGGCLLFEFSNNVHVPIYMFDENFLHVSNISSEGDIISSRDLSLYINVLVDLDRVGRAVFSLLCFSIELAFKQLYHTNSSEDILRIKHNVYRSIFSDTKIFNSCYKACLEFINNEIVKVDVENKMYACVDMFNIFDNTNDGTDNYSVVCRLSMDTNTPKSFSPESDLECTTTLDCISLYKSNSDNKVAIGIDYSGTSTVGVFGDISVFINKYQVVQKYAVLELFYTAVVKSYLSNNDSLEYNGVFFGRHCSISKTNKHNICIEISSNFTDINYSRVMYNITTFTLIGDVLCSIR